MHTHHLALAGLALALLACGPRQPPARPGQTIYWRVSQSSVDFTGCTDDATFRGGITAIPFDENTYVIYRMAKDGQTATAQTCTTFAVSSCQDSTSGVVYQAAGAELLYSHESKQPIGNSGACQVANAESWILTDQGTTLAVSIRSVLSLVDDPPACQQVEAQVKAQSPNGLGLQGCVVQYALTGVEPRVN